MDGGRDAQTDGWTDGEVHFQLHKNFQAAHVSNAEAGHHKV